MRGYGRLVIGLGVIVGVVLLGWLGVWQLQRRTWKHELIARVDARVHAAPVPAPAPREWPDIDADRAEYRRVSAGGVFRYDRETLVQAVTERGGGFWVMTPLVADGGYTILINRGFIPPELRDPARRQAGDPQGHVDITGLLRMSEPKGGFLRSNAPEEGRWYSRDVAAIAASQTLGTVAPYFIDADARPNPGGYPVGGLTVISFTDNHLVYALTWFGLAAMLAGYAAWAWRVEPGAETAGNATGQSSKEHG